MVLFQLAASFGVRRNLAPEGRTGFRTIAERGEELAAGRFQKWQLLPETHGCGRA